MDIYQILVLTMTTYNNYMVEALSQDVHHDVHHDCEDVCPPPPPIRTN